MYSILTYPLDVIKTNRILETPLSKHQSIPKEFVALFESAGLQHGVMRGLAIGAILKVISFHSIQNNPFISAATLSLISNPLNYIQVHKQVFYEEPMAYKEIVKKVNPVKMVTVGLAPTFMRNLVMLAVCKPIPKEVPGYGSIVLALSFASVVVSHPFEVMRVHLQYKGSHDLGTALVSIYNADGISGFFKGFAPRAITMMPVMATWMMYQSHQIKKS